VNRLLDTAQIGAGKLHLDPYPVDLADLVRGVIAGQPASGGRRVRYVGPERLEARVDALRMEEVVTNLVENAMKFSPEAGVVTVELGIEGGDRIRLAVSDEGAGIPEDERALIFDRFHQAQNSGNLSGMGLGLFVSREIVELHGGSIRVEDAAASRGACFVISLPARRAECQAETAA
jgi:signal transduction histidine kinase